MMPLRTESASEKKTKVVENFLCFPTVAYTPKPDKENKSYRYGKTAHRHRIPARMNTCTTLDMMIEIVPLLINYIHPLQPPHTDQK
jgi:hypothetical protein